MDLNTLNLNLEQDPIKMNHLDSDLQSRRNLVNNSGLLVEGVANSQNLPYGLHQAKEKSLRVKIATTVKSLNQTFLAKRTIPQTLTIVAQTLRPIIALNTQIQVIKLTFDFNFIAQHKKPFSV